MTTTQNNLLTMGQSVSTSLETITATDVPPALAAVHPALKTAITEIQTIAAAQGLPTTGITRERDRVFATSAEATLLIAGLVLSYAKRRGLEDLAAKVDLNISELARGRFNLRIQRMQQVHAAATEVMAHLADFNVTAARLADLQAKITAAAEQITAARDSIVTRRVATEKLAEAFGRMTDLIEHHIDPLIEDRREIDPDAYKRYQAARVVIVRPGPPDTTDPKPATNPQATTATATGTLAA
jgi:hypothetical protein